MKNARRIDLPYPKDAEGNPLCRWCQAPVKAPRTSWCSAACVTEYRSRYDSSFQRRAVKRRDKGICSLCDLDTLALAALITRLHFAGSTIALAAVLSDHGLTAVDVVPSARRRRIRVLWEMDHTLPVSEGGGGTTLANLRTLCVVCHKQETAALAARRAVARRAGK